MDKDQVLQKYLQENMKDYEGICKSFFKEYPFDSETNLSKFIEKLTPQEFHVWEMKMIKDYDEKYNFIRTMIMIIRGDHTYDSENDPLKEEKYKNLVEKYRQIYESVFSTCYASFNCVKEKTKDYVAEKEAEQKERALTVNVEGQVFKAIDMCDVLWAGWECDCLAWVVVDNGKAKLVTSNHGAKYFETAEFLKNKIEEYEQAIKDSRRLLSLLKKND